MEEVEKEKQESIKKALTSVAEETKAAAKKLGKDPEYVFFSATSPGPLAERVRNECKLGANKSAPAVVIMDISDNGACYRWPDCPLDKAGIQQLMAKHKEGE